MKRIIAIGFISLATMIIMAHAIIPHHHHDGIPVALSSEICQAKNECHCHDADYAHSHNHPSEDCNINDFYFRLENERLSKSFNVVDFSQALDFGMLFYENPILKVAEHVNLPFREKPYIESNHTVYITQSLGLRAPPVC
jgi:hypothetical protein